MKQHVKTRLKNYALAYLPNIGDFLAVRTGDDPILKLYDIRKATREIIMDKGELNRPNNYLKRQYGRLLKAKERNEVQKFEAIMTLLIARSDSYMLACMHQVPTTQRWYKDMGWFQARNMIQSLRSMRRRLEETVSYRRKFIPKMNGELRPLGVPSMEWRVFSRMWYIPLSIWFSDRRSTRQHGFIPGRGVATAWKYILRYVVKQPNIIEFDLKKFFDNVNIMRVVDRIAEVGFSGKMQLYFSRMLTSKVMVEPGDIAAELNRMRNTRRREYYGAIIRGDSYVLANSFNIQMYGLPQGLGLSPYLSTMVIDSALKPGTVMYADDGLIFGPTEKKIMERFEAFKEEIGEKGVSISEDKTNWVKYKGVWAKPLKFLGCEYDGNTGIFRASTRTGKNTVMEWKIVDLAALERGEIIDEKGRKWKVEEVLKYNSYYYKNFNTLLARIWAGDEPLLDIKGENVRCNSYAASKCLIGEPKRLSTLAYRELLNEMGGWKRPKIAVGKLGESTKIPGRWSRYYKPRVGEPIRRLGT